MEGAKSKGREGPGSEVGRGECHLWQCNSLADDVAFLWNDFLSLSNMTSVETMSVAAARSSCQLGAGLVGGQCQAAHVHIQRGEESTVGPLQQLMLEMSVRHCHPAEHFGDEQSHAHRSARVEEHNHGSGSAAAAEAHAWGLGTRIGGGVDDCPCSAHMHRILRSAVDAENQWDAQESTPEAIAACRGSSTQARDPRGTEEPEQPRTAQTRPGSTQRRPLFARLGKLGDIAPQPNVPHSAIRMILADGNVRISRIDQHRRGR